jgi:hypothetical protein
MISERTLYNLLKAPASRSMESVVELTLFD